MTYPSLRKVSYTPDRAGRPAAVSGVLNNVTTSNASAVKYAEHGALKSANWGSGPSESWTFNNRLQPCAEQLQNAQFTVLARFEQYYSTESAACGAGAANNNGSIPKQTIAPLNGGCGRRLAAGLFLRPVGEPIGKSGQLRSGREYDAADGGWIGGIDGGGISKQEQGGDGGRNGGLRIHEFAVRLRGESDQARAADEHGANSEV